MYVSPSPLLPNMYIRQLGSDDFMLTFTNPSCIKYCHPFQFDLYIVYISKGHLCNARLFTITVIFSFSVSFITFQYSYVTSPTFPFGPVYKGRVISPDIHLGK